MNATAASLRGRKLDLTVKHRYIAIDGVRILPEGSARAYLRDLPEAEFHLLDGGHWALETNLAEIVALVRDFLGRVRT